MEFDSHRLKLSDNYTTHTKVSPLLHVDLIETKIFDIQMFDDINICVST